MSARQLDEIVDRCPATVVLGRAVLFQKRAVLIPAGEFGLKVDHRSLSFAQRHGPLAGGLLYGA
jgi:hypothetical protein